MATSDKNDISTCSKCGNNLLSNEIEIFGELFEIGGFCPNEKCERYLLLVVV